MIPVQSLLIRQQFLSQITRMELFQLEEDTTCIVLRLSNGSICGYGQYTFERPAPHIDLIHWAACLRSLHHATLLDAVTILNQAAYIWSSPIYQIAEAAFVDLCAAAAQANEVCDTAKASISFFETGLMDRAQAYYSFL